MKKTGFEKSFNFKQILITLAAGAAVLLPVRIYQPVSYTHLAADCSEDDVKVVFVDKSMPDGSKIR